ncbi:MAG TPA: hypothetical protein VF451_03615 [Acidobacteriota bacterium]
MASRSFKLFLLLALTLTLTLSADDFFAIKDKVIEESRFKLGFLYFTPLFLLENVGYTSSIYTFEKKDTPDWTGDLGLGLRASAIAADRLILQAEDLPYYSYYQKNKELRSWSNGFGATAYTYAGPFNFKAGFKRNDLRQRPQFEFSRPYHYQDNEWSGEIDFGRYSDLFVTAYAAFDKLTYDDTAYLGNFDLAAFLNHRENIFGVRLNKHVFTGTIVYANYEHSDYRFANRSERDSTAQELALGVEFPEIGVMQGSFQIGLKRFSPNNPLFKEVQRPSGRGDIKITLMERLRISGFYELDTLFSYSASDLFYDNSMFGGGVEVYLTTFLKVGASYQDGRMKYHSFRDLELLRSDRIRQQRYYLAIPFFGNTSLGFSYNVYRLTSDVLNLDYTRSFWGGFISYEF